jgi:hypothetical protein
VALAWRRSNSHFTFGRFQRGNFPIDGGRTGRGTLPIAPLQMVLVVTAGELTEVAKQGWIL